MNSKVKKEKEKKKSRLVIHNELPKSMKERFDKSMLDEIKCVTFDSVYVAVDPAVTIEEFDQMIEAIDKQFGLRLSYKGFHESIFVENTLPAEEE